MVGFWHVVRLRDVENGRANNLNLIRFLLASSVIFSHSYVALGLRSEEPMQRFFQYLDMGAVAVDGFFFISGFLILGSALRRHAPENFLASRVLRIFPGLFATVLLCVFVFGPLLTTLPLGTYFRSPLTWSFLSELWMHRMQHLLPGVCVGRVLPVINGPLWTLPGEWTMYMATLVACSIFQWRQAARWKVRTWLVVIASLALTAQMMPLPWHFAKSWIAFYLAGSACYLLKDWVPLSLPLASFLAVAEILLLRTLPQVGHRIFPLALCYLIATVGYHPRAHFKSFHRIGDPSYGLYIYGMPIQQLFLERFAHPLPFFAFCYPIVLVLALTSWHFLENPALSLKGRFGKSRINTPALQ